MFDKRFKIFACAFVATVLMTSCSVDLKREREKKEYVCSQISDDTNSSLDEDKSKPVDVISGNENAVLTVTPDALSEKQSVDYGCLQEIIDYNGFPIGLSNTEGMTITRISIFEHSAERIQYMTNGECTQFSEGLSWSITDDILTISGEWNEEFSIDYLYAVSRLDGKGYYISFPIG